MTDKGTCKKHGDFILAEGCPQCLKEKWGGSPQTSKTITTAVVSVKPTEDPTVLRLREEILKVRDYALERVVKTPQDAKVATNDLSIISHLKKDLETKRVEFVKPLQTYVKEINATFKLISEPLAEADKATREQILAFNAEQERLRREAEEIERLRREAEEKARKLKEETGEIIDKPEETVVEIPPEVSTRVHADLGTSAIAMIKKWEVVDFDQVPERYKEINTKLVGKVVRAGGDIPGIRVWEEPSLRVTAKKGE